MSTRLVEIILCSSCYWYNFPVPNGTPVPETLCMCKKLIPFFITILLAMDTNSQIPAFLSSFRAHKQIPVVIEKNVLTALSFFPELINTPIRFHLKKSIRNSVMQAQPVPTTLLRKRQKRQYRINISEQFKLLHTRMPITDIPDTVMIGWIGHELGHILDYESKSNYGMMAFGYRYYFHPSFVKEAERAADTLAVTRGMGRYIIATKRFILDHAELPQTYKDKISRLYLSPDIILEMVQKLEVKQEQEKLP